MFKTIGDEEKKKLVSDTLNRWNEKRQKFEKNINCEYSDEYKNLESSLKKITTFVKKIKCFSDSNSEGLMKEVELLNLNRYISEIVSAILELKFKICNIPSLINFISKIHLRYREFSNQFFESLDQKLTNYCLEDDKDAEHKTLKLLLRLYCDSIFSGLTSDIVIHACSILKCWESLLKKDGIHEYSYCTIFAYFVKTYSEDFGFYGNSSMEFYAQNNLDFKQNIVIGEIVSRTFFSLVDDYYQNLKIHCLKCAKNIEKTEKSHKIYIGLNGDLLNAQKEKFKQMTDHFDKIISSIHILSEFFNEDFVVRLENDEEEIVEKLQRVDLPVNGETKIEVDNIWEDEENRQFYENLKDCSSIITIVSPKDLENIKRLIRDNHRNNKKTALSSKIDEFDDDYDDFDVDEYESRKISKNSIMDAFLTKLQNCINRDLIDQCVDEFLLYLNSKANRKTLLDALFSVNRNRCDLLPFYGRFIATIFPYIPEIAIELTIMLRGEFYYHIRKQFQFNLESKIKTCRYIGELVKFKMITKLDAIQFLKALLLLFQNHQIDMLCHLLESCGRFLYNSIESNALMLKIIETINRKSNNIADERHKIMLQNAIFCCDVSKNTKKKHKKNTCILHQFLKNILFEQLNRHSIRKSFDLIKKFPLHKYEFMPFLIKCLTSPWKLKYSQISCLASLVYCLSNEIDKNISIFVIDGVLEEIRLGLETNICRYNQRRICTIKYLAELYNFQLIECDIILKVCFNLMLFGQNLSGYCQFDPPNNFTRIILICELLKGCGQYLINDDRFKNFQPFLIFFQAYIWKKKLSDYYLNKNNKFPLSIDFNVQDTFEFLKMRKRYFNSPQKIFKIISQITDLQTNNVNELIEKYADAGINYPSIISSLNDIDHDDFEELNISPQNTIIQQSSPPPIIFDEENQFQQSYEKTLIESMNERFTNNINNKHQPIDVSLPSYLKDTYSGFQDIIENEIDNKKIKNLKLLLLTKKNNKKCLNNVQIPKSDSLAVNFIEKYQARKDEQQQVKRFILNNINNDNSIVSTKESSLYSAPVIKIINKTTHSNRENKK